MKKALLVGLLFITSSALAEWVKVGEINEATFYIDPSTIRKQGNIRKVSEIQDRKLRDQDGVMSRRIQTEYDCKDARYRSLSFTAYSAPMAEGKTMYVRSKPKNWVDIVPLTVIAGILETVCAK